jgi:hypothetical protein
MLPPNNVTTDVTPEAVVLQEPRKQGSRRIEGTGEEESKEKMKTFMDRMLAHRATGSHLACRRRTSDRRVERGALRDRT